MMKKLTMPKISLTRKQIILISSALFLVLASVIVYAVLKNPTRENNTQQTNIQENTGEGYAESEKTESSSWQKAYSTETDPKILVYGEIADNPLGTEPYTIDLTEKCEYEDKETEESTYVLGSTPIEVRNHCILTLSHTVDPTETQDTLTAYLVLPDNSVISLSSNGFPTMQVNIYEKETRIVQMNSLAYYRISPQEDSHIFTVELPLLSRIFTATGTELYAEMGFTEGSFPQYDLDEGNYAGGFFLYEGSGNIRKTGSTEILESMDSNDNTNIYYGFLSLTTFQTEAISLVTDTLDMVGRADFLTNQKAWSEKYGFGNFSSFTTDTLKAFVYEHTEDVYAKTVSKVEEIKAEENRKWEEMQDDDDNYSSSSGSSSTGSSSSSESCYAKGSASYQLFCQMSSQGTIKDGKCCVSY